MRQTSPLSSIVGRAARVEVNRLARAAAGPQPVRVRGALQAAQQLNARAANVDVPGRRFNSRSTNFLEE
jgi:hypothetical protein